MKYRMLYTWLYTSLLISCLVACSKKLDKGPGSFTAAFSNVSLKPAFLVPGDTATQSLAVGIFNVRSDSSMDYDIYFPAIAAGETPQGIAIYSGNPVTNGTLLLNLDKVSFTAANEATGSVRITDALMDSFAAAAPMYVVVGGAKHANGLVRGQITGLAVSYAADISLTTDSIKPAISATTTGSIYLRLLSDGTTLYSRITVNNLPAGDSIISAAIRTRQDKAVVLQLASSAADFGVSRKVTLASALATAIQNGSLYYADIRTKLYPAGLVQGYYK